MNGYVHSPRRCERYFAAARFDFLCVLLINQIGFFNRARRARFDAAYGADSKNGVPERGATDTGMSASLGGAKSGELGASGFAHARAVPGPLQHYSKLDHSLVQMGRLASRREP